MFPNTEVSLGGLIQGLQLNTTGAFAAYIVTVLLGTWIVKFVVADIGTFEKSMWTVRTDVKISDDSGHLINDPVDLAGLTVDIVPPVFAVTDKKDHQDVYYKHVEVHVPVVGNDLESWPSLVSVPNCVTYSTPIKDAQLDDEHHLATLEPITLVKIQSKYNPTPRQ